MEKVKHEVNYSEKSISLILLIPQPQAKQARTHKSPETALGKRQGESEFKHRKPAAWDVM